mmetsp:Transcript_42914/g.84601  ORF Transcript_42914/g.84601 Transcript_42914/m.84601 type:complete len:405 (-) Transcript_42914:841-2055(-)
MGRHCTAVISDNVPSMKACHCGPEADEDTKSAMKPPATMPFITDSHITTACPKCPGLCTTSRAFLQLPSSLPAPPPPPASSLLFLAASFSRATCSVRDFITRSKSFASTMRCRCRALPRVAAASPLPSLFSVEPRPPPPIGSVGPVPKTAAAALAVARGAAVAAAASSSLPSTTSITLAITLWCSSECHSYLKNKSRSKPKTPFSTSACSTPWCLNRSSASHKFASLSRAAPSRGTCCFRWVFTTRVSVLWDLRYAATRGTRAQSTSAASAGTAVDGRVASGLKEEDGDAASVFSSTALVAAAASLTVAASTVGASPSPPPPSPSSSCFSKAACCASSTAASLQNCTTATSSTERQATIAPACSTSPSKAVVGAEDKAVSGEAACSGTAQPASAFSVLALVRTV